MKFYFIMLIITRKNIEFSEENSIDNSKESYYYKKMFEAGR